MVERGAWNDWNLVRRIDATRRLVISVISRVRRRDTAHKFGVSPIVPPAELSVQFDQFLSGFMRGVDDLLGAFFLPRTGFGLGETPCQGAKRRFHETKTAEEEDGTLGGSQKHFTGGKPAVFKRG